MTFCIHTRSQEKIFLSRKMWNGVCKSKLILKFHHSMWYSKCLTPSKFITQWRATINKSSEIYPNGQKIHCTKLWDKFNTCELRTKKSKTYFLCLYSLTNDQNQIIRRQPVPQPIQFRCHNVTIGKLRIHGPVLIKNQHVSQPQCFPRYFRVLKVHNKNITSNERRLGLTTVSGSTRMLN